MSDLQSITLLAIFKRWMDITPSWERPTWAIRPMRDIDPIRHVYIMEVQPEQSEGEPFAVHAPPVIDHKIKSYLRHGALGSRAQNLRHLRNDTSLR
jgi:hypothetical protein